MNNASNIWYFEDIDLYNILCPHKVPSMKERHTFHKFNKGDFIYFEDEQSDHLYLVAEGRVKIGSYTEEGKEVTKAILATGEIFGELALMGQDKRSDFAPINNNYFRNDGTYDSNDDSPVAHVELRVGQTGVDGALDDGDDLLSIFLHLVFQR
jgi:hypothetical protein